MESAQGLPKESIPSSSAGEGARSRTALPDHRIGKDAPAHLERPGEARLHLQRRAPANLRHHVRRGLVRLAVLIAADIVTFGAMRELLRAVRDHSLLGERLASRVQAAVPSGYLSGWQLAVALFIGLLMLGNYGPGDRRRDPSRLFAACAFGAALPLWTTLWARGPQPVLLQYCLTVALVWLGLLFERFTIDRIGAWLLPPERDQLDTLFVGAAAECESAFATPTFASGKEYRPIGFVDVQVPPAPGALGHVGDLPLLLAASGARVVTLCGYLTEQQFQDVVDVALAGGCQVLAIPRAMEIAGVHPTTVWRRGQPLVELTAPSLKGQQLVVKRALDLAGSLLGLLALSPLFAVLAAIITLDSPGPVFFSQERVGTGGRRFRVWKFRTMRHGVSDQAHRELVNHLLKGDESRASSSAKGDERVYKLVNDERVTRVGRFLRRTSLDELPQLLNVMRGEMSLVGPRPPLPYEFEQYDHWQFDRLGVRPGITGLWQVSGRNRLTYRQMCELDLEYIREWSLALDLKILLKTIPVVLSNSGRAA